ncbi:hypothetical protein BKA65DRAFT_557980 [Rhexocercosporidium sp. MPI-PUGE-AT-0058]|nr:hypothetical protein BKA65DRAFT_557980 [Rhexocercosporidium sp. MPI-PUGE-AT-0058]
MSSNSYQNENESRDITPHSLALRTVHSIESLDMTSAAIVRFHSMPQPYSKSANKSTTKQCILDITIPEEQSCRVPQALKQIENTQPQKETSDMKLSFKSVANVHQDQQPSYSKDPFDFSQSHDLSTKKPISLSEHMFDQIEHFADLAKRAALTHNPNALDHIDDIADCATGLAIDLLEAQVEIERIKKQYEVDHVRVEDAVFALRTSRIKLEGERDRVQDLAARLNGIKFDHMTALAKYQVQKAQYEYQAEESQKLRRTYRRAVAELEATKEEREKELVMMATQMWNLKLMVGDMFARSEWTLRDGVLKAGEEIDFTLARLENIMNASIKSRNWAKDFQESSDDSAPSERPLDSWALMTKDSQDSLHKLQVDQELLARNDMEYNAGCGSCVSENDEGSSKAIVLDGEDRRMQEDSYWHEGEYHF